LNKEKWEWIEGWEGDYEVSNLGRVRSYKLDKDNGKIITGGSDSNGYFRVMLHNRGSFCRKSVHSLVATAFICEKPEGLEINHIDGDKRNNNSSNLEYLSHKDNMLHSRNNGLRKSMLGVSNINCKLDLFGVLMVRNLKGKMMQKEIAFLFDILPEHVRAIQIGKYWGNVK